MAREDIKEDITIEKIQDLIISDEDLRKSVLEGLRDLTEDARKEGMEKRKRIRCEMKEMYPNGVQYD